VLTELRHYLLPRLRYGLCLDGNYRSGHWPARSVNTTNLATTLRLSLKASRTSTREAKLLCNSFPRRDPQYRIGQRSQQSFLEDGTQRLIIRCLFAVEWTILSSPSVSTQSSFGARFERSIMSIGTILLIILILILLGALPTWPYSSGWGYYPSGGLGFVVVILLILVLLGRV
jgi:hypothetical protein